MVFLLLEDRSAATPRASCKSQRRSFLVLGEIHSTAQPGQQQCSSKACRRLRPGDGWAFSPAQEQRIAKAASRLKLPVEFVLQQILRMESSLLFAKKTGKLLENGRFFAILISL